MPPGKIKISVVVPTYNEGRFIRNCLVSLNQQTIPQVEVFVVDDGSTDETARIMARLEKDRWNFKLIFIKQRHCGPGVARNNAAFQAQGEVLVFIDADMTFADDFLEKVSRPILQGKFKGTDSQDGVLANGKNFWALCWNLGKFAAAGNYSPDYKSDVTPNKHNHGGIFRAILKSEFLRVGGFDTDGDYSDDASLGKKLKAKANVVTAKFYHYNPDTLREVWWRARWIGAGRNFTGSTEKKLVSVVKFFPLVSLIKGFIIGLHFGYVPFVFFKVIYDLAVLTSVLESFRR